MEHASCIVHAPAKNADDVIPNDCARRIEVECSAIIAGYQGPKLEDIQLVYISCLVVLYSLSSVGGRQLLAEVTKTDALAAHAD